ncbi:MAG: MotA/TolQ/ExbB proton channel family protein [Planctomycetaceae bacterium]
MTQHNLPSAQQSPSASDWNRPTEKPVGFQPSQLEEVAANQLRVTHSTGNDWLSSPWIWGGLLTVGVYLGVPHLPIGRDLAIRYLCGHPLEYALATLFCVSLAILGRRFLALRTERQALVRPFLPHPVDTGRPLALQVNEGLSSWSDELRQTWLGQRLTDLCEYLEGKHSVTAAEQHAKYLADDAYDRCHDQYALLQTITWAVPILGFLGTVMGITLAIANVTPDQLDSSLNEVTGGLAVAFDTTALALTFSIVMVFGYFFVKRSDEEILRRVNQLVLRQFIGNMPTDQTDSKFMDAESEAARQLIHRTEELIGLQTELWTQSVDGLRERWNETLEKQQAELTTSLTGGVGVTLSDHAAQLFQFRQEFVEAYRDVSEQLSEQMADQWSSQTEQQQELQQTLMELWKQIRQDLTERHAQQATQTQEWVDRLSGSMGDWQERLTRASEALEGQLSAITSQTELLRRIVDQEENLAGLQQRLAENLEAVRAAEAFEETLHSLNAAVHLLTARARPNAA